MQVIEREKRKHVKRRDFRRDVVRAVLKFYQENEKDYLEYFKLDDIRPYMSLYGSNSSIGISMSNMERVFVRQKDVRGKGSLKKYRFDLKVIDFLRSTPDVGYNEIISKFTKK